MAIFKATNAVRYWCAIETSSITSPRLLRLSTLSQLSIHPLFLLNHPELNAPRCHPLYSGSSFEIRKSNAWEYATFDRNLAGNRAAGGDNCMTVVNFATPVNIVRPQI